MARVLLRRDYCGKFVRLSALQLLDGNELARYGQAVADDNISACKSVDSPRQVDCVAYCGQNEVGVEFTSWAEGELREDKLNKNVRDKACGSEILCALVVGTHKESLPYVRESLAKHPLVAASKLATVSEEELGRLKDEICSGKQVVILALGGTGVQSCGACRR